MDLKPTQKLKWMKKRMGFNKIAIFSNKARFLKQFMCIFNSF